jgi:hypothetical protein
MRFQKRIKLFPGVTVNLSKKGVSTSLGLTGARVTYGHGQKRTTVGLPGSGLSHSTVERGVGEQLPATGEGAGALAWRTVSTVASAVAMVFGVLVMVITLGLLSGSGKRRRR